MELKNKSAEWLQDNSVLVLIDADGKKIVPSAMEIYEAEFKQISKLSISEENTQNPPDPSNPSLVPPIPAKRSMKVKRIP